MRRRIDRLRASADGGGDQETLEYRRRLAAKAFQHVAAYDTAIAQFMRGPSARTGAAGRAEGEDLFPQELTVGLQKTGDLRYGENPHLKGAIYREDTPGQAGGLLGAELLHGMEMSYLNYLDADAAWRTAIEFD